MKKYHIIYIFFIKMDLKFKKKVLHTFLLHAVNVGSLIVFKIIQYKQSCDLK